MDASSARPGSEPLHGQISRHLRERILTGDLPAGAVLPSIRALAREREVSVITVRHAYQALEREGLICALRGRGFFVAPLSRRQTRRIAEERFARALEHLLAAGRAEGLSRERLEALCRTALEVIAPEVETHSAPRDAVRG